MAVQLAWKDKIEFAIAVAYGSSLQVALFVAPVLVLLGRRRRPADGPRLHAAGGRGGRRPPSASARSISLDGESNWLEGALLVLVYVILAVWFFELADRVGPAVADGARHGRSPSWPTAPRERAVAPLARKQNSDGVSPDGQPESPAEPEAPDQGPRPLADKEARGRPREGIHLRAARRGRKPGPAARSATTTSSAARGSRPTTGEYRDNLTPATGEPFTEVPRSRAEDIELALDAAHAAKDAWGETLDRPSAPRSSTRSPTRSRRTSRCSRSPRARRTASRSARRSPPTSRWRPTTSATSPARSAPRRAGSPRSTRRPTPTTSTSRWASSARSSRSTSRC